MASSVLGVFSEFSVCCVLSISSKSCVSGGCVLQSVRAEEAEQEQSIPCVLSVISHISVSVFLSASISSSVSAFLSSANLCEDVLVCRAGTC